MGPARPFAVAPMDYFLELYATLPRAGPGDAASTRRAFAALGPLPDRPVILDLGCGPGRQTIELLRSSRGTVVAVDLLSVMVSRARAAARDAGLLDRLRPVQGDMQALPFRDGAFDVVWSEGAIYFLGFERGLDRVARLVKPGGYVAVSEAVWLRPDPPPRVVEFWRDYPEIDTVPRKLDAIARLGFEPVAHFVLPPEAWTTEYYDPLRRRLADVEAAWSTIPAADAVLREARTELEVFAEHGASYGYAFFVIRT